MIRDTSYIHIGGWMLNKLKLKGNELIVYATIYSFTNGTDDHCFHGSANYLSEWCGISRRQVMKILQSLVDKGYIIGKDRYDNGVKFVDYFTPYEKSSQGGYEKSSHHNNSSFDNNSIGSENNNSIASQSASATPSQTATQGDNNSLNRNNADAKTRVPKLDKSKKEYIVSSDDVKSILTDDEIAYYREQLSIVMIFIKAGYKLDKSKNKLLEFINWLKSKAILYNIKKPNGEISWTTLHQKIDKRYDWHDEKQIKIKNYKLSIIPFISK